MAEPAWALIIPETPRSEVYIEAGWANPKTFTRLRRAALDPRRSGPSQLGYKERAPGGLEVSSRQPADPVTGSTVSLTEDSLVEAAMETFGSKQKAEHWLHRPNQLFQGRTPLEMILVDPCLVEAELIRIDHGIYL